MIFKNSLSRQLVSQIAIGKVKMESGKIQDSSFGKVQDNSFETVSFTNSLTDLKRQINEGIGWLVLVSAYSELMVLRLNQKSCIV